MQKVAVPEKLEKRRKVRQQGEVEVNWGRCVDYEEQADCAAPTAT